ncbi:hypothetical protein B484DRAFT_431286, partial [Ochromonadaceae sp. CCMP2298]
MAEQVRRAGKRPRDRGVAQMRSQLLEFHNFFPWGKHQRQIGTVLGDANKELHLRRLITYPMPVRTEKVKENVVMENSKTVPHIRSWGNRDSKILDNKVQEITRKVKDLQEGRGALWTNMTSAISRKVMDATEMEPTYKTIETQVSSLGLYLLLEQVCTKNSVNNVEMLRTKLIDHHYQEGECVYAFITELDALFKSIDMASGADGQIRDHDKVYRLREALPKTPVYKTMLMSAHTHVRGDPEYPTYEWCKRVVTNFLHDKSVNLNEEDDDRGTSLSLRQNPRGGKNPKNGNGKQHERVRDQKSQNPAQVQRRPNLPLPEGVCIVCRGDHETSNGDKKRTKCTTPGCRFSHDPYFCFFNVFSPHCYPDILDRYNAEQKRLGKKPIVHNTPRGSEGSDSARDYRGRSLMVAREEAEMEQEEDPVPMYGNYMASPYAGGRCYAAACYTDADGTGVDYGDTPNSSPVREEEGKDMEVDTSEAQGEEVVNHSNTPTDTPHAPAPPITQAAVHPQSPHRVNVSVQGIQGVHGYSIEELEAALTSRRAAQLQSNQILRGKGWGTLVLPTIAQPIETHTSDTTAPEGVETLTQPQLQAAEEGVHHTSDLAHIPADVATVLPSEIPEKGNQGTEHTEGSTPTSLETMEEMAE